MSEKISLKKLEQLSINPRYALGLYEAILKGGLIACEDESTFIETVRHLVHIFLRFEDYISSNNLCQVAISELPTIEQYEWYRYVTLQIITMRVPKYILYHPEYFIRKLDYLQKYETLRDSIEAFLSSSFDAFLNYLPYFDEDFRVYVHHFSQALLASSLNLSQENRLKLISLRDLSLRQSIKKETIEEVTPTSTTTEKQIIVRDDKACFLIVGDLSVKKHDVQGIAKEFGIHHQHLDFVDYQACKQYPFRQLYYSPKYAGIILGPVPHMTSDLDGHTSLVTLLKEKGYPYTFIAMQEGELKLSKNMLKKGFSSIVQHVNQQGGL